MSGWEAVFWPIDLRTPPEVVSLGVGQHGFQGKERFHLPDLWCLHFYPYTATVRLGDQFFPIRPGFAGLIPPNTRIEYDYPAVSQHLFVHFRCVSTRPTERILAMQDLGTDFSRFYGRLEQAVRGVRYPAHRTQARVWDLLCELTERGGKAMEDTAITHPAVQFAVARIELRMGGTISVADLAREAQVSYSYLGRLFQAAFGMTVVAYIRARRMQRAEHLLRHSTLPIKVIAATVGLPDLHLFNKCVRKTLGQSPRAIRGYPK
ncbi:MAG: helix-turn-helix transcriptional regulator [Capsulimonadales bacterium]|nr:helix-turn-helix transcriptional regulator [Capsulimonadales bacterium]